MRRLSRSILVLSFVVALITPTLQARVVNDDQDPRGGRVPPIVKVIKKIVRLIYKPWDDGGLLLPPHP
jgi:hypothetical protein